MDLVGAEVFAGIEGEADRSKTVGAAVDEVAEKDEFAALSQPLLALRRGDERFEQIRAPVNVADGENFRVRRGLARQSRKFPDEAPASSRSQTPALPKTPVPR